MASRTDAAACSGAGTSQRTEALPAVTGRPNLSVQVSVLWPFPSTLKRKAPPSVWLPPRAFQ